MEKKFTRNKDAKVEKIIQTTLQLLDEQEYDSITTNLIASKAKIGIGTIYRNFPLGKDEIIHKIVEQNLDDISFLALPKDAENKSISEYLFQFFFTFIANHRDKYKINLAFQKSFISHKQLYADYVSLIKTKIQENILTIQKTFQLNPTIYPFLPDKIYQLYNMVEALVHRHIYEIPITQTDEELCRYLVKIATMVLK